MNRKIIYEFLGAYDTVLQQYFIRGDWILNSIKTSQKYASITNYLKYISIPESLKVSKHP